MSKHTKQEILAAVTLLTEAVGKFSERKCGREIAIVWRNGVSLHMDGHLIHCGNEAVAAEIFALQKSRP